MTTPTADPIDFPCPHCRAEAGDPCRRPSGRKAPPHADRKRLADETDFEAVPDVNDDRRGPTITNEADPVPARSSLDWALDRDQRESLAALLVVLLTVFPHAPALLAIAARLES